jgi:hypothetical protein
MGCGSCQQKRGTEYADAGQMSEAEMTGQFRFSFSVIIIPVV